MDIKLEETNEIFVHGWAGATDAVLSISQIPAGIIAKSECKWQYAVYEKHSENLGLFRKRFS